MPGSLICSLFSRASFPSLDIIFMIRSSKCSSRQVSFPLKRLQTETRADSLSRPCHTPTLAFCANYTIYLMCSVGVSLSKYNLHPAGQSWICAGNPVPFALKCFLLRKVLDWVGAIVALGIYKGVFNSESFPNIHGKKKKSLIINYSNAHSFLKHFKDVYIETRCLPPQVAPISVDFTVLLLTSVFSVGSLFHLWVERMFLLFAFLAITVASLGRELPPCWDLAGIPSISLLEVARSQGGKSFLIPPRAWANFLQPASSVWLVFCSIWSCKIKKLSQFGKPIPWSRPKLEFLGTF